MDQRRPFRHLTKDEIRGVIDARLNNTPTRQVAQHFNIDVSTVLYHVGRHKRSAWGNGNVVSLQPKACIHPSLKCLLCGVAQDELRRREREYIRDLETQVSDLTIKLNAVQE